MRYTQLYNIFYYYIIRVFTSKTDPKKSDYIIYFIYILTSTTLTIYFHFSSRTHTCTSCTCIIRSSSLLIVWRWCYRIIYYKDIRKRVYLFIFFSPEISCRVHKHPLLFCSSLCRSPHRSVPRSIIILLDIDIISPFTAAGSHDNNNNIIFFRITAVINIIL